VVGAGRACDPSLLGTVLGGRLGDARPFAVALGCFGVTVVAVAGLWVGAAEVVPTLLLFTLLGLVGFSANPILTSLAIHYGGGAPALAAAMPTSIFNLGTAIGTGVAGAAIAGPLGVSAPLAVGIVAGAAIAGPLGVSAPLAVGIVAGVLIFIPVSVLLVKERRSPSKITVRAASDQA
jgi:predicted MFS family arabinose efflux permease